MLAVKKIIFSFVVLSFHFFFLFTVLSEDFVLSEEFTRCVKLRRSSVDFRASESSWIEALEGIGSSLAPS